MITALLLVAQTIRTASGVHAFRVEASHSDVAWSVPFMFTRVRGRFDDMQGTVLWVDNDPTKSVISIIVDVASINSGSKFRDEHLKSEDFFDARNYPDATFHSERIEKHGTSYIAVGPLSFHGITRQVRIPFHLLHPVGEGPHGTEQFDVTASLKIARKDFGILGGSKNNSWFDEARSRTMGDTALIELNINAFDAGYDNPSIQTGLDRVHKQGVQYAIGKIREATRDSIPAGVEWYVNTVARALMDEGRSDDAVAMMQTSAEVFKSAEAHAILGELLYRSGKKAEARQEFDWAVRIDPKQTRAQVFLHLLLTYEGIRSNHAACDRLQPCPPTPSSKS